jgi:uncharacterized membrane protein
MLLATRFVIASVSAVLVLGCDSKTPLELARNTAAPALAKGGPGSGNEFATRTALPPLQGGAHGEAYAIDRAGTLIGGYSWDKAGRMHPVTWSLVNGSWQITAYPWDATATSAVIRGINDNKDKAGTFWPGSAPRAVLWNASGGFTVLGCSELGETYALSSGAQVVVGTYRSATLAIATLWSPGQCRETLPSLNAGGDGVAYAVNGDGTIVGGVSSFFPVRWRRVNGSWQVEQLDSRQGGVLGSNSAGDLVGGVGSACTPSPAPCRHDISIVWYANGGSRVLPTLSGGETAARAINSAGEVVGMSRLANGNGVPFIWSETLGIRQLPLNEGWAFTISDVRADGTRLVAGAGGRPFSAQVWVVRNP